MFPPKSGGPAPCPAARRRSRRSPRSPETSPSACGDAGNGAHRRRRAVAGCGYGVSRRSRGRTPRSRAHDGVGVLVDVGEEVVERPLDRVGEHERARQERDADHDRERRADQPGACAPASILRLSLNMLSPRTASCGRGPARRSGSASRRRSGRRRGTPPGRRTPAATGSWVTITIVWPSSPTARRMNSRISALARLSRLPVGSSAKMISGRLPGRGRRRRAAAGHRRARSGGASGGRCSPTVVITPSTQSWSGLRPASAIGRVMFS